MPSHGRAGFADGLNHRPKNTRRKTVLWPEPVLMRFVETTQHGAGGSAQHDCPRRERIVLRNEVLRDPTATCSTPHCNRGASLLFTACRQEVEQRIAGSQQTTPVFPHEIHV